MPLVAEPLDPADVPTGYVPPDLAALAAERDAVSADLGNRYRVGGFVARGGFASVWAAFDDVEKRDVAVKRIHPKVGRGRDFFRELRAMFALDHPNVVRIVNFLEAGATRYLILELCGGGSLRSAISAARRGGPQVPAADVVRQLAGGLAAAHKLGLTHRDLKPENVLFAGRGGAVKLADFGLATLFAGDDGGALKALTGSPAYMAPEQFCGAFGPASDVYALGVIAFELLTGDVPFVGAPEDLAYHHLRTTPTFPTLLAPWRDLLPAMLAKEPTDRPTAADVAAAFGSGGTGSLPARGSAPTGGAAARTARGSAGIIPLDHPADQVIAGEGEWLVGGRDGFTRIASDAQLLGFVTLRDLSSLTPKPGGAWCAAGREIFDWDAEHGSTRLGEAHSGAVLFADGEQLHAASLSHDSLLVQDVRGGAGVWRRAVPCGGLRPKLARLADGSFACTDFDGGPGLRFLSADGEVIGRVPLPGICWHLCPWANGGCAARLLTGGGFHAFRVSPRGVRPLPGGSGVVAVGADISGRIAVGAWGDGTVKLWEPQRAVRSAVVPVRGTVRGVATDGARVAVVWVGDGGARVTVAEPE